MENQIEKRLEWLKKIFGENFSAYQYSAKYVAAMGLHQLLQGDSPNLSLKVMVASETFVTNFFGVESLRYSINYLRQDIEFLETEAVLKYIEVPIDIVCVEEYDELVGDITWHEATIEDPIGALKIAALYDFFSHHEVCGALCPRYNGISQELFERLGIQDAPSLKFLKGWECPMPHLWDF
jgi:hypothetical protein